MLRQIRKIISSFLILAFAAGEISHAGSVGMPPNSPLSHVIEEPSLFEAPLEFASLKDVHKGNSGKLILHVQDAHANLSGQRNLAHALDDIMGRYGVSLVLVEGGFGDVSLTPLKELLSPDARKKVAKKMLFQGTISGEEYLNLTSDHPMRIFGIEDAELYFRSVRNYGALAASRESTLAYLAELRGAVRKLKAKDYPADLAAYEKLKADGEARETWEKTFRSLIDLAAARGVELAAFPNAARIRTLFEKEARIDFNAANLEQAALLEELRKKTGVDEFRAFADSFAKAKGQRAAHRAMLLKLLSATDGEADSPNLKEYASYLSDFLEVDLDDLLLEITSLEDAVYKAALQGEDARLVRAIDRYLTLLDVAYKIRMTTRDFESFLANEPDFATPACLAFVNRRLADFGYAEDVMEYKPLLETGKTALKEFYNSVDKRDEAFLENARKALTDSEQNAAVLISGGYHTAHLKKLFRKNGYSYMVLTPNVEGETNLKKYESLVLAPLSLNTATVEVAGEGRAGKSLSALDADLTKKESAARDGVRSLSGPLGARVAPDGKFEIIARPEFVVAVKDAADPGAAIRVEAAVNAIVEGARAAAQERGKGSRLPASHQESRLAAPGYQEAQQALMDPDPLKRIAALEAVEAYALEASNEYVEALLPFLVENLRYEETHRLLNIFGLFSQSVYKVRLHATSAIAAFLESGKLGNGRALSNGLMSTVIENAQIRPIDVAGEDDSVETLRLRSLRLLAGLVAQGFKGGFDDERDEIRHSSIAWLLRAENGTEGLSVLRAIARHRLHGSGEALRKIAPVISRRFVRGEYEALAALPVLAQFLSRYIVNPEELVWILPTVTSMVSAGTPDPDREAALSFLEIAARHEAPLRTIRSLINTSPDDVKGHLHSLVKAAEARDGRKPGFWAGYPAFEELDRVDELAADMILRFFSTLDNASRFDYNHFPLPRRPEDGYQFLPDLRDRMHAYLAAHLQQESGWSRSTHLPVLIWYAYLSHREGLSDGRFENNRRVNLRFIRFYMEALRLYSEEATGGERRSVLRLMRLAENHESPGREWSDADLRRLYQDFLSERVPLAISPLPGSGELSAVEQSLPGSGSGPAQAGVRLAKPAEDSIVVDPDGADRISRPAVEGWVEEAKQRNLRAGEVMGKLIEDRSLVEVYGAAKDQADPVAAAFEDIGKRWLSSGMLVRVKRPLIYLGRRAHVEFTMPETNFWKAENFGSVPLSDGNLRRVVREAREANGGRWWDRALNQKLFAEALIRAAAREVAVSSGSRTAEPGSDDFFLGLEEALRMGDSAVLQASYETASAALNPAVKKILRDNERLQLSARPDMGPRAVHAAALLFLQNLRDGRVSPEEIPGVFAAFERLVAAYNERAKANVSWQGPFTAASLLLTVLSSFYNQDDQINEMVSLAGALLKLPRKARNRAIVLNLLSLGVHFRYGFSKVDEPDFRLLAPHLEAALNEMAREDLDPKGRDALEVGLVTIFRSRSFVTAILYPGTENLQEIDVEELRRILISNDKGFETLIALLSLAAKDRGRLRRFVDFKVKFLYLLEEAYRKWESRPESVPFDDFLFDPARDRGVAEFLASMFDVEGDLDIGLFPTDPREADRDLLDAVTKLKELQAANLGGTANVVSAAPDRRAPDSSFRDQPAGSRAASPWKRLAAAAVLAGTLGAALPAPGHAQNPPAAASQALSRNTPPRELAELAARDPKAAFDRVGEYKKEPWAKQFLLQLAEREHFSVLFSFSLYKDQPYATEVLEQLILQDPDISMGLFTAIYWDGKEAAELLRRSTNPVMRGFLAIYESDLSRTAKSDLALLIGPISRGLSMEAAGKMLKDPKAIFRYMMTHSSEVHPRALRSAALNVVLKVNELHNETDAVRFGIVSDMSAKELYLLMVHGEEEIFTSTFNGLFNRFSARLKAEKTDGERFLASLQYGEFRTFFKMSVNFNRLNDFFATAPAARERLLVRFVKDLEHSAHPLPEAVAVADTINGLRDATILRSLQSLIRSEFGRVEKAGSPQGKILYGLLGSQLHFKPTADAWTKRMAAQYPMPRVDSVPASALEDANGEVVQQHFFFNDEDGRASFASFTGYYRNNPRWVVSRPAGKPYVIIRSRGTARKVTMYLNLPESGEGGSDQILADLDEKKSRPTVVVQRGHSYHAGKFLSRIRSQVPVAFLGACGGYRNVAELLLRSPGAAVFSTKGTGRGVLNNSILWKFNDYLAALPPGKELAWRVFWEPVARSNASIEGFPSYVPPHQNIGVIFLRAYKEAAEKAGAKAPEEGTRLAASVQVPAAPSFLECLSGINGMFINPDKYVKALLAAYRLLVASGARFARADGLQRTVMINGKPAKEIDRGGEGTVYGHPDEPGYVVKVYHERIPEPFIQDMRKLYERVKDTYGALIVEMRFVELDVDGQRQWCVVMPYIKANTLTQLRAGGNHIYGTAPAKDLLRGIDLISQEMFGLKLADRQFEGEWFGSREEMIGIASELYHNFLVIESGHEKRLVNIDPINILYYATVRSRAWFERLLEETPFADEQVKTLLRNMVGRGVIDAYWEGQDADRPAAKVFEFIALKRHRAGTLEVKLRRPPFFWRRTAYIDFKLKKKPVVSILVKYDSSLIWNASAEKLIQAAAASIAGSRAALPSEKGELVAELLKRARDAVTAKEDAPAREVTALAEEDLARPGHRILSTNVNVQGDAVTPRARLMQTVALRFLQRLRAASREAAADVPALEELVTAYNSVVAGERVSQGPYSAVSLLLLSLSSFYSGEASIAEMISLHRAMAQTEWPLKRRLVAANLLFHAVHFNGGVGSVDAPDFESLGLYLRVALEDLAGGNLTHTERNGYELALATLFQSPFLDVLNDPQFYGLTAEQIQEVKEVLVDAKNVPIVESLAARVETERELRRWARLKSAMLYDLQRAFQSWPAHPAAALDDFLFGGSDEDAQSFLAYLSEDRRDLLNPSEYHQSPVTSYRELLAFGARAALPSASQLIARLTDMRELTLSDPGLTSMARREIDRYIAALRDSSRASEVMSEAFAFVNTPESVIAYKLIDSARARELQTNGDSSPVYAEADSLRQALAAAPAGATLERVTADAVSFMKWYRARPEYSMAQDIGERQSQEDRIGVWRINAPGIASGQGTLFAVMDGHGAKHFVNPVVNAVEENIALFFREALRENAGDVKAAFRGLFARLTQMTDDMRSEYGTTVSVVYKSNDDPGLVHIAVLGDSPVVIASSSGQVLHESPLHDFTDPHIVDLVRRGLAVVRNGRISLPGDPENDILVSRALGDYSLISILSRTPDIASVRLPQGQRAVLLLASDGVLNPLEPGTHRQKMARLGRVAAASKNAAEIVTGAFDQWERTAGVYQRKDNISALLVKLSATAGARAALPVDFEGARLSLDRVVARIRQNPNEPQYRDIVAGRAQAPEANDLATRVLAQDERALAEMTEAIHLRDRHFVTAPELSEAQAREVTAHTKAILGDDATGFLSRGIAVDPVIEQGIEASLAKLIRVFDDRARGGDAEAAREKADALKVFDAVATHYVGAYFEGAPYLRKYYADYYRFLGKELPTDIDYSKLARQIRRVTYHDLQHVLEVMTGSLELAASYPQIPSKTLRALTVAALAHDWALSAKGAVNYPEHENDSIADLPWIHHLAGLPADADTLAEEASYIDFTKFSGMPKTNSPKAIVEEMIRRGLRPDQIAAGKILGSMDLITAAGSENYLSQKLTGLRQEYKETHNQMRRDNPSALTPLGPLKWAMPDLNSKFFGENIAAVRIHGGTLYGFIPNFAGFDPFDAFEGAESNAQVQGFKTRYLKNSLINVAAGQVLGAYFKKLQSGEPLTPFEYRAAGALLGKLDMNEDRDALEALQALNSSDAPLGNLVSRLDPERLDRKHDLAFDDLYELLAVIEKIRTGKDLSGNDYMTLERHTFEWNGNAALVSKHGAASLDRRVDGFFARFPGIISDEERQRLVETGGLTRVLATVAYLEKARSAWASPVSLDTATAFVNFQRYAIKQVRHMNLIRASQDTMKRLLADQSLAPKLKSIRVEGEALTLIEEGEEGNTKIYILTEGYAIVRVGEESDYARWSGTLEPYDVFGEITALGKAQKATATVVLANGEAQFFDVNELSAEERAKLEVMFGEIAQKRQEAVKTEKERDRLVAESARALVDPFEMEETEVGANTLVAQKEKEIIARAVAGSRLAGARAAEAPAADGSREKPFLLYYNVALPQPVRAEDAGAIERAELVQIARIVASRKKTESVPIQIVLRGKEGSTKIERHYAFTSSLRTFTAEEKASLGEEFDEGRMLVMKSSEGRDAEVLSVPLTAAEFTEASKRKGARALQTKIKLPFTSLGEYQFRAAQELFLRQQNASTLLIQQAVSLAQTSKGVLNTSPTLLSLASSVSFAGENGEAEKIVAPQFDALKKGVSELGKEVIVPIGKHAGLLGGVDVTAIRNFLREHPDPASGLIQYSTHLTDSREIEAALRQELTETGLDASEIDAVIARFGVTPIPAPVIGGGQVTVVNVAAAMTSARITARLDVDRLDDAENLMRYLRELIPNLRHFKGQDLRQAISAMQRFNKEFSRYADLVLRAERIPIELVVRMAKIVETAIGASA